MMSNISTIRQSKILSRSYLIARCIRPGILIKAGKASVSNVVACSISTDCVATLAGTTSTALSRVSAGRERASETFADYDATTVGRSYITRAGVTAVAPEGVPAGASSACATLSYKDTSCQ